MNDRIPALLPEDVAVAHVTGELPGVPDDAEIVRFSGTSFIIIAAMSHGGDPVEKTPGEARIWRMAHDHYCP